ncbi:uncharacterized protein F4822DRAFT_364605 [Hypoxylon trugodes]|uniref:uncharacterized protein n=1 Tax=Hypoxylon trugodes TaxID=326681 RepID=UPI0021A0A6BC|nr:uncharacterized protein F4822DRAFT_364605 [Hypoxylon trugodes]KAI1384466.1 hypothetical protein F4822DRAFT_364605 [Hypoxylon trugodes]
MSSKQSTYQASPVNASSCSTSTAAAAAKETAVGGSTPTEQDILRKPWKHIGYRGYSDFLASDNDFFVLRRFNTLNVRIALLLQDELAALESELSEMDANYSNKDAVDINNGTLRCDQEDRIELLEEIRQKLRHYNEFILQQTAMKKYQSTPLRVVKFIRNWHHNHDYSAINKVEQEYLEAEKDLISIAAKDKMPVRQLIDQSRRLRTLSIWKQNNPDTPDHDAPYVTYYSDKRIDSFASGIIVAIGVIMLIAPLWILQFLAGSVHKLIVITLFVFVFLIILSIAMAAKPFEALGATAAYAAVLMVFLQFGNSSS